MRFQRKLGFYEKYVKRVLDIICSLLAFIIFCWLYGIIALAVRVIIGSPVIFRQPRPGMIDPNTGRERIFYMYKFRTMSDEKGQDGKLLPDEQRLGRFGRMLRAKSLDELPEALNILRGDMSVIGPRPQLVRDMVFMTDKVRMRHMVRPGLSGLAQVKGRNAISWDQKFMWDLKYVEKVSFWGDLKILRLTIKKVFGRGGSSQEIEVTDDYGDYLLKAGRVNKDKYDALQEQAQNLLENRG